MLRKVIGGGWQWVELFFAVPYMAKLGFWIVLLAILIYVVSVAWRNVRGGGR